MNLVNPRSTELSSIPFLNNALDWILSRINTVWRVEHDGEGHHTDVTADTLDVDGDVTISGDVSLEGLVDQIDLGTAAQPIVIDGEIVGPETFREITDGFGISVTADTVRPAVETSRDLIPSADDTSNLGWVGDGDFVRRWRSIYFSQAVYGPTVIATTGFYETGYSTGLGKWTAVSFSAGDFTGSASMTWTVASGDVSTNRYTVVGKTLLWSVVLVTTTVGGTPDTVLRIAIPGGFTPAAEMQAPMANLLDNGFLTDGFVIVRASQAYIEIRRQDLAAFTAATNATQVCFQIAFEVQ